MKTGTLVLAVGCLVLLPACPGFAQLPGYNPAYGPFTPTSPNVSAGFGTSGARSQPAAGQGVAALPSAGMTRLPPAVQDITKDRLYPDYQRPSAVSPYMNLYRFNPGGVVSNYYSLVRPALEQQRANQQFRASINSLNLEVNRQKSAAPDIHRPGYYLNNYGTYFAPR